jgi:four helix bundle protein
MLKSGTFIGALVRESEHVNCCCKQTLALDLAINTKYWLSILNDIHYIDVTTFNSLNQQCSEIINLLTDFVNDFKKNNNQ